PRNFLTPLRVDTVALRRRQLSGRGLMQGGHDGGIAEPGTNLYIHQMANTTAFVVIQRRHLWQALPQLAMEPLRERWLRRHTVSREIGAERRVAGKADVHGLVWMQPVERSVIGRTIDQISINAVLLQQCQQLLLAVHPLVN